jgi:two-component system chemotaxis response regulator CheY
MPRVLVVEDDALISDLLADVLQGHGFEVDTAQNGAVAMEMVRARAPDAIVLDLMMPVMDGWEFMRQYQQLPGYAAGRILVISAVHHQADVQVTAGQFKFLGKPFDLAELVEAVTQLTATRDRI